MTDGFAVHLSLGRSSDVVAGVALGTSWWMLVAGGVGLIMNVVVVVVVTVLGSGGGDGSSEGVGGVGTVVVVVVGLAGGSVL